MDLTKLKLFAMTRKRMDWLSKRQEVLAQNIANADTPKYQPKDLKKLDFRDLIRETRVAPPLHKTSDMHIPATRQPSRFKDDPRKDAYEVAPAGNSVVLEEQLMKVSETQANYRLATNLYSKHLRMIRVALGRPDR